MPTVSPSPLTSISPASLAPSTMSATDASLSRILAADMRRRRGPLYAGAFAVLAVVGFVWYAASLELPREPDEAPVAAAEAPALTPAVAERAPAPAPAPRVLPDPAPRARFAYDSARLGVATMATLDNWAELMAEDRGLTLRIEGHADERGSAKYNHRLGKRRADAAKAYLVAKGVDPARVATISYGKSRPLARGKGEQSFAKNRRVELKANARIAKSR